MASIVPVPSESVLLLTLDSCRFDTFAYAADGFEAEAQVAWIAGELAQRPGPAAA